MFSKRPREHILSASPFSFCVPYFGELLEDDGSTKRSVWGNLETDHPVYNVDEGWPEERNEFKGAVSSVMSHLEHIKIWLFNCVFALPIKVFFNSTGNFSYHSSQ